MLAHIYSVLSNYFHGALEQHVSLFTTKTLDKKTRGRCKVGVQKFVGAHGVYKPYLTA